MRTVEVLLDELIGIEESNCSSGILEDENILFVFFRNQKAGWLMAVFH